MPAFGKVNYISRLPVASATRRFSATSESADQMVHPQLDELQRPPTRNEHIVAILSLRDARWSAFLMNQRKLHPKGICNLCGAFGSAGVGGYNHGVLVVGYVVLNPPLQQRATV